MVIDSKNNFTMTRGDSESITVVCGQKPFVDGDEITFTLRKRPTAPKSLKKTVAEFDEGKAVIEIRPEDTQDLNFSQYVYDIQIKRADGMVKTIMKGNFEIEWEVSYDG